MKCTLKISFHWKLHFKACALYANVLHELFAAATASAPANVKCFWVAKKKNEK